MPTTRPSTAAGPSHPSSQRFAPDRPPAPPADPGRGAVQPSSFAQQAGKPSKSPQAAKELRALIKPSPQQKPALINQRIRGLLTEAATFTSGWQRDKAILLHTQGAAMQNAKGCGKLLAWFSAPNHQQAVLNASNYAASTAAVLWGLYKAGQLKAPHNAAELLGDLTGVLKGLQAGLPKSKTVGFQVSDLALGSLERLQSMLGDVLPGSRGAAGAPPEGLAAA